MYIYIYIYMQDIYIKLMRAPVPGGTLKSPRPIH